MGCGRAGESPVWISAGAERSRAAEAPEVRRSQRRDERATRLDVRHTRRRPNAGNRRLGKETTMSRWAGVTVLGAAVAVMTLGCAQGPSATAAVVENKTYTVTPASVTVKAGIITGEVTELKVMERVEQGSDRVVSPAKLTGTLKLKNTSTNQTVRLVAGKILYVDAQGQPIKLEDARSEPTVKFSSSSNLDPGQETTESMDVEFPAEALKAARLKEIRVDLAYITSPYREETLRIPVSIGGR